MLLLRICTFSIVLNGQDRSLRYPVFIAHVRQTSVMSFFTAFGMTGKGGMPVPFSQKSSKIIGEAACPFFHKIIPFVGKQ